MHQINNVYSRVDIHYCEGHKFEKLKGRKLKEGGEVYPQTGIVYSS